MSTKIYTVDDLLNLMHQFNAEWKSAKCEEELPAPPNFSGCSLDPIGLIDSLDEVNDEITWLREYFSAGVTGQFQRYAVAKFDLPIAAHRAETERHKGTLIFSHKELGDIFIDINYEYGTFELEFVSLV